MMITGLASFVFGACKTAGKSVAGSKGYPAFFKVGHRGTRGVMPENTIPAMEKGDILGHEFMGEVVEVGKDNKKLKVGDRVVVPHRPQQW